MAEDSEDTVVSLQDVLEENRQLEETANAVLGPSDDSSCTYSKGYVDRQALYSCATCSAKTRPGEKVSGGQAGRKEEAGEEVAGVCLGCSLHCHEGHDLYELYTKRNFRCDCGNSKFPDTSCLLCPEKDPLNLRNSYNHNFHGLYCTCSRPYPDPDDDIEDEMIQCCLCEDWFHSRHLGGSYPPEGYEEMVCDGCMASHEFLKPYKLCGPVKVGAGEKGEEGSVDVTTSCGTCSATQAPPTGCGPESDSTGGVATGSSGGREEDTQSGRQSRCQLVRRRELCVSDTSSSGAGYFASSWRSQLCRCQQCTSLYAEGRCLFLLEEADTISSYEALATSQPSTHESAMTAFSSSLDRVHQVEALHQYNDMKSELVEFLNGFAREGKVVARRDVEGFFEGLQQRKRRRLDTGDGVPPAKCHF